MKKKDVKGNEPKLDRKQRKTRGTNPIEPINEAIEESDKVSIMSKLSRFPGQSQVIDLESMDYGLSATRIGFAQAFSRESMRPGFTPENENGMCLLSGGDGGTKSSEEQDDKNCQERRGWGIQPILTPWEPWEWVPSHQKAGRAESPLRSRSQELHLFRGIL